MDDVLHGRSKARICGPQAVALDQHALGRRRLEAGLFEYPLRLRRLARGQLRIRSLLVPPANRRTPSSSYPRSTDPHARQDSANSRPRPPPEPSQAPVAASATQITPPTCNSPANGTSNNHVRENTSGRRDNPLRPSGKPRTYIARPNSLSFSRALSSRIGSATSVSTAPNNSVLRHRPSMPAGISRHAGHRDSRRPPSLGRAAKAGRSQHPRTPERVGAHRSVTTAAGESSASPASRSTPPNYYSRYRCKPNRPQSVAARLTPRAPDPRARDTAAQADLGTGPATPPLP